MATSYTRAQCGVRLEKRGKAYIVLAYPILGIDDIIAQFYDLRTTQLASRMSEGVVMRKRREKRRIKMEERES